MVKNPPANTGDVRDIGLVSGSGRSPGGGHGNPLQYSCWRIPWTGDRGVWQTIVLRVAKKLDITEATEQASKIQI